MLSIISINNVYPKLKNVSQVKKYTELFFNRIFYDIKINFNKSCSRTSGVFSIGQLFVGNHDKKVCI